ncbi:hypothetical protein E2C01_035191 [Portunus trituberculatus]|uniref:Uncharacterized protein n=1 Tax=Portunus trituberculatus TaxID=210409 RepID=A0A5B7F3J4_PORTR|nr:hypothetical protein [Portunus trituberculatus]
MVVGSACAERCLNLARFSAHSSDSSKSRLTAMLISSTLATRVLAFHLHLAAVVLVAAVSTLIQQVAALIPRDAVARVTHELGVVTWGQAQRNEGTRGFPTQLLTQLPAVLPHRVAGDHHALRGGQRAVITQLHQHPSPRGRRPPQQRAVVSHEEWAAVHMTTTHINACLVLLGKAEALQPHEGALRPATRRADLHRRVAGRVQPGSLAVHGSTVVHSAAAHPIWFKVLIFDQLVGGDVSPHALLGLVSEAQPHLDAASDAAGSAETLPHLQQVL